MMYTNVQYRPTATCLGVALRFPKKQTSNATRDQLFTTATRVYSLFVCRIISARRQVFIIIPLTSVIHDVPPRGSCQLVCMSSSHWHMCALTMNVVRYNSSEGSVACQRGRSAMRRCR